MRRHPHKVGAESLRCLRESSIGDASIFDAGWDGRHAADWTRSTRSSVRVVESGQPFHAGDTRHTRGETRRISSSAHSTLSPPMIVNNSMLAVYDAVRSRSAPLNHGTTASATDCSIVIKP